MVRFGSFASKTKSPNKQQMEELSLWVFSDKEVTNVESELRERLLKSPRMKSFEERWKINRFAFYKSNHRRPKRKMRGNN